jgi:GT2 family glycosyltransferase
MNLSVVIPTCDRPVLLRACLLQLQASAQTYPRQNYTIIVSDDGRTSLARPALAAEFPNVTWVEGPRRGPAANRNTGAAAARGDVLVFLDDDCLPQPGLLSAYAAAFADPALLAAEGRIRGDRPHKRMDEVAPLNETGGVFWSCNIGIRRDFYVKIGGFDERFPAAAMEDIELQKRILKLGVEILFLPEALVIHPLRFIRGWGFLRKRAEAHGIYILIPGCYLPPPSYRWAVWHTLRLFRREFLPRFIELRGRGAYVSCRSLTLPIWSTWCMKKALRLAKADQCRLSTAHQQESPS